MTYLDGVRAEDLDWRAYLAGKGRILESSAGRRTATRLDPLLFSLVYFRPHLTDRASGTISFAQLHLDMCRRARQWARQDLEPQEIRDAWVAWRESGKSTWNFLILPTWALAHQHRRYALAFADSGMQAEQHLLTFRQEIGNNVLLRRDFPQLTTPGKRASGDQVADNRNMYVASSGVVFQAKGIDSSTLGAKFTQIRPDLILLDDIEPDESNYSQLQKEKRLHTVQAAVFPMNLRAAVSLTGTVTMADSIVHDLVRQVREPGDIELPEWPREERFRVRDYPVMRERDDGTQESAHERRFPIAWMTQPVEEGARRRVCDVSSFLLNMMNNPRGKLGGWWTEDDFRYGELEPSATRWFLQIDGAVTSKEKSDYTALVVAGGRPGARPVVELAYARQVKLVGEPLRKLVINILDEYPRIKAVRIEVNQGGDLWRSALHDLPVQLITHTSEDPKEVRLAGALDWYQRQRVFHTYKLDTLEQYMLNYPKGLHDDLPDCAALAVLYFLGMPPKRVSVQRTAQTYAR